MKGEPLTTICEDMRLRERELDFVIENMRQGLWRLNSFGIITYVNPYLAEWLESKPGEMVGQHFSKYRCLRVIAGGAIEQSLSQRYEAEFSTSTGIVRRAIVVTSPMVDHDGSVTGTVDLITDITAEHAVQAKLVQEVQKMSQLASTDPLTGVANRMVFDLALNTMAENASDEPFGLLLVDLDYFKEINDSYGHEFGDKVLVEVARRLQSAVREADVVARVGGDEFVVLLPNATKCAMEEVVDRLRDKLTFEMVSGEREVFVHVSLGVAHSSENLDDIHSAADQSMYLAKHFHKASLA